RRRVQRCSAYRSWRCETSRSLSAVFAPSPASRSIYIRAKWSAWSAATVPERQRSCARSREHALPTRGRSWSMVSRSRSGTRAMRFNARALIRDEPTAALGPAETAQVHNLIKQLKSEGIGIFLVSHDIHDVFDLSERISVMYHGRLVDTVNKNDVTTDEVLGMIILGKPPTKLTRQELAELHG